MRLADQARGARYMDEVPAAQHVKVFLVQDAQCADYVCQSHSGTKNILLSPPPQVCYSHFVSLFIDSNVYMSTYPQCQRLLRQRCVPNKYSWCTAPLPAVLRPHSTERVGNSQWMVCAIHLLLIYLIRPHHSQPL